MPSVVFHTPEGIVVFEAPDPAVTAVPQGAWYKPVKKNGRLVDSVRSTNFARSTATAR